MASKVVFAKLAWHREDVATPILSTTQSGFDRCQSFDDIQSFPSCLQPLDIILKLAGMRSNVSIFWQLWAWIYRILVVVFSVIVLMPNEFTGSKLTNTLWNYVESSHNPFVDISLICTMFAITLCSIYPLFFIKKYIQNGQLHQLLKYVTSTKHIQPSCDLHGELLKTANRCRYYIIFSFLFQWIGWTAVVLFEHPARTLSDALLSTFWPFAWGILKWFQFSVAMSVLFIVLTILRKSKALYIAQIAASDWSFRRREEANNLYFVCHNVDTSQVLAISDRNELKRHLIDFYLNLSGLCSMQSVEWMLFLIILCFTCFCCVLSAFFVFFYCGEPSVGTTIMLPGWYVMSSSVLLYEMADLNNATDKILQLLSASRFDGKDECCVFDGKMNRILAMMQYNRIQITIAGVVVDKQKVNAVVIASLSVASSGLMKYFLNSV